MLAPVGRLGRSIACALVFLASCIPDTVSPEGASTSGGPFGTAGPSFSSLVDRWRATTATIVYRTVAKIPGQPTSTHQCLRQMVGGAIDRQNALRMCSRQGRLELAWDPPGRWRMDLITPLTGFRLVSVAGRAIRCEAEDRCRRVASPVAASAPFGFLLAPNLGAPSTGDVVSLPSEDVAGIQARCFSASGGDRREWCFSDDGLLLSFLGGAAGDWTSLEAVSVSRQVDAADFEVDPA